jgi:hypothetical protein
MPQLVAQNLLRGFSQVAEAGSQFAQFLVAYFSIVFAQPAPFQHVIGLHEQQYRRIMARAEHDKPQK